MRPLLLPRTLRPWITIVSASLFSLGCGGQGLVNSPPAVDSDPSSCQAGAPDPKTPGMWGTNDTSRPSCIDWVNLGPDAWVGAHNLDAQWQKILATSPARWNVMDHAKAEPPG